MKCCTSGMAHHESFIKPVKVQADLSKIIIY